MIDDNLDSIESTAELLRYFNYETHTATDGSQGVHLVAEIQPQLILCDIGLPDMDGYQLLPLLQQAAADRKTIIAAVTGYGYAEDHQRSKEAGFDAHLVKPIDAQSLLAFVAQQVANY